MDIRYYETQENSDPMEGRGPMVTVDNFINLEDAVEDAKGRGVWGVGDGDVVRVDITVNNDDSISVTREKVYGYRRDLDGRWGYGYIDLRNESEVAQQNPEYQEYLRLKGKFEN